MSRLYVCTGGYNAWWEEFLVIFPSWCMLYFLCFWTTGHLGKFPGLMQESHNNVKIDISPFFFPSFFPSSPPPFFPFSLVWHSEGMQCGPPELFCLVKLFESSPSCCSAITWVTAWLTLGLKYVYVLAGGEQHLPQCFKTQARHIQTIFIHLTGEDLVTRPHVLQGSLANMVYLNSPVSCYHSMATAEREEDFGGWLELA